MQSIRLAVFHTAQPVGSSAAANSQSHNNPFAKGFLRGGCAAANSQKHIRSLQKYVCMLLCFTGKLFV